MQAKTDELPGIRSKMDDVAEALAAVRVLIVSTASTGETGRDIAARWRRCITLIASRACEDPSAQTVASRPTP